MSQQLEEEIRQLLVNLMTDGFNRSLNALRDAKAVNTKKMDGYYCGIGSKYYDMVTDQMELTTENAKGVIHEMVTRYEERKNQHGPS